MRWARLDKITARDGDRRTRRAFLLWPLRIGREMRWLERTSWVEVAETWWSYPGRGIVRRWTVWCPIAWVAERGEIMRRRAVFVRNGVHLSATQLCGYNALGCLRAVVDILSAVVELVSLGFYQPDWSVRLRILRLRYTHRHAESNF